jgi:hypothetical protein
MHRISIYQVRLVRDGSPQTEREKYNNPLA